MRTRPLPLTSSVPFAALFAAATFVACGPKTNTDGVAASDSASGTVSATPAPAAPPANCDPLETRPTEAKGQSPAFAGQTRACAIRASLPYDVTVVATGIAKPWSVEPLPNGDFLVTEKKGNLRIVSANGTVGAPINGVPAVDAKGQGGLLDVALSPSFNADRTIYWSYAEPRTGGNATSVAKGVLSADNRALSNVRVIFRALPVYDGDKHYGSRLEFGRDGMLYVTLGERSDTVVRPQAQQLSSHMGKILRITPDGAAPPDNPFVGQANAKPEIWSVGHRNVQAAAFDESGQLWDIEHGTRGGDELNKVEKGKNYGWADVAYGIEYKGGPIGAGVTQKAGTEQPTYYWDPVIAPSGAQFYNGAAFPGWRGNLFVGALKEMRLVRLVLENGRVTGEEHLLTDRKKRIRDVKQGADGALYVVTDDEAGELWKISPKR